MKRRDGCATRFEQAIVRRPGRRVAEGLRAVDVGAPDLARLRREHERYVAALSAAGLRVTVAPALDAFPDSIFVEDVALCLPEGALLLRPGAPSRRGEVDAIAPALSAAFAETRRLDGEGTVDGGDALMTETEILVGRSARTDADGIAALARAVADWGWAVRAVETPAGVLHFKSDCGLLDAETVLSTPRLAASGCFAGYRVLETPEGEAASANVVRVNDVVLLAAGFPRTAELLDRAGYALAILENAEAAKLDGGLSCKSLRF